MYDDVTLRVTMGIDILGWLQTLPAELIYIAVFFIVGIGSIGIPSPIQAAVAGAAFLASQNVGNPWIVWGVAALGSMIGALIGYNAGLSHGHKLLTGLEKLYPKHINPKTARVAEKAFRRHGVKTIFLGRALTGFFRVFSGPIAGSLKMSAGKFHFANITSAIFWCGLTVWIVYFFGIIADQWLDQLSWVAFLVAMIVGVVVSMVFQKQFMAFVEDEPAVEQDASRK